MGIGTSGMLELDLLFNKDQSVKFSGILQAR